jgi:hypothetical protein
MVWMCLCHRVVCTDVLAPRDTNAEAWHNHVCLLVYLVTTVSRQQACWRDASCPASMAIMFADTPLGRRFPNASVCVSTFQVRYTGYRDRPQEERQVRFQNGCREGHTEIVSSHLNQTTHYIKGNRLSPALGTSVPQPPAQRLSKCIVFLFLIKRHGVKTYGGEEV